MWAATRVRMLGLAENRGDFRTTAFPPRIGHTTSNSDVRAQTTHFTLEAIMLNKFEARDAGLVAFGAKAREIFERREGRDAMVRDRFITLVEHGKLSPENAEAFAARSGLQKIAREPEWPAFDPLREAFWTAGMAVVWIAARRIKSVRRVYPEFCAAAWEWRSMGTMSFPTRHSEIIHRKNCFWLSVLRPNPFDAIQQRSERCLFDAEGALEQLLFALRHGRIAATAICLKSEQRTSIPDFEWMDYILNFNERGEEFVSRKAFQRVYRSPLFRAEDLLECWPEVKSAAAPTESEALTLIQTNIDMLGRPMTNREADALRADKCAGFPREKFRSLLKRLQGPQKQGRRPKVANAPGK